MYSHDIARLCEMILIRNDVNRARKRTLYKFSKARNKNDDAKISMLEVEVDQFKKKLKEMTKAMKPLAKKAGAKFDWDANWRIQGIWITDHPSTPPRDRPFLKVDEMQKIVDSYHFERIILGYDEDAAQSA